MIVDFSGDGFNSRTLNFYGFDNLSDNEIIDLVSNSTNPELMGSKLGDWMKRRKKNVQKFTANVKAKFNTLPKWAKIATGVALAPVALATAPAALSIAPVVTTALPTVKTAGLAAVTRKLILKNAAKRAQIAAKIKDSQQVQPQVQQAQATMEAYKTGLPQAAVMETPQQDYQEQSDQPVEEKKSILPAVLAAASFAIPFLLRK